MKLVAFKDWAKPGTRHPGKYDLRPPLAKLYIHHTVTPRAINGAAEITQLREIDRQHRAQGWDGIGYNFIVGPSGTVYEGRGQRVGAHNDGENSSSWGIAFLGTFTDALPTPAAMMACAELIQVLLSPAPDFGLPGGALTPGFVMRGHRDADATACPGNKLYANLPSLRALVGATPTKENPVTDTTAPAATPSYKVSAPPVGISMTPSGQGYLIICADGGVFAFGDAVYAGRIEEPSSGAWNRYFGIA